MERSLVYRRGIGERFFWYFIIAQTIILTFFFSTVMLYHYSFFELTPRLLATFFTVYLISLTALSSLSFYICKKVLAPINRLKNYFAEVENTGQVMPLHFRQGDFLQELPPRIIGAMQAVESRAHENSLKAS